MKISLLHKSAGKFLFVLAKDYERRQYPLFLRSEGRYSDLFLCMTMLLFRPSGKGKPGCGCIRMSVFFGIVSPDLPLLLCILFSFYFACILLVRYAGWVLRADSGLPVWGRKRKVRLTAGEGM